MVQRCKMNIKHIKRKLIVTLSQDKKLRDLVNGVDETVKFI